MFSVYCPNEDVRVLLGPESIEALVSTPDGIALHWRCTCGAAGVWFPQATSAGIAAAKS